MLIWFAYSREDKGCKEFLSCKGRGEEESGRSPAAVDAAGWKIDRTGACVLKVEKLNQGRSAENTSENGFVKTAPHLPHRMANGAPSPIRAHFVVSLQL